MCVEQMEARIAHLEGGFRQVGERLNSIDRRLDGIDRRFDSLEHRMDVRFNGLTGVVIATWITTILAILFHH